MKKLLLLLIAPVLVIAQEQEYFVNGVNIKDIKSEFIRIDHYGDASKKKVYINFLGDEQCPKMSSFPNLERYCARCSYHEPRRFAMCGCCR